MTEPNFEVTLPADLPAALVPLTLHTTDAELTIYVPAATPTEAADLVDPFVDQERVFMAGVETPHAVVQAAILQDNYQKARAALEAFQAEQEAT